MSLLVVDAEDCAQDDDQGDALHLALHRKRPAHGPIGHHPLGDLLHDSAVDVHAIAVEGRQEEAALAEMARPVESTCDQEPGQLNEPEVRPFDPHRLMPW